MLDFDEMKQNTLRLVEHLPVRYELAFAASLLEELNMRKEADQIWRLLKYSPDFKPDHSSTKEYLDLTGNTDNFYMYYVKNKAATIAAVFGWNPDICSALALEVIKSISISEKLKVNLIKAIRRRNLPSLPRHN